MRGGVSVSVHLHVRVGTAKGEDGEGLRVFFKKEGRRWKKQERFREKVLLFSVNHYGFERKWIFCSGKISLIRNIVLIFALDKTQLYFFLSPSGVYHSAHRRTSSRYIYANDL